MNPYIIPGIVIAVAAAIRGMWSPCGLSMISAITPMSERAKGHRFGVTALWFTLGGVVGGATTGAAMALGAWAVAATGATASLVALVFGVVALVTVASDLELFGFGLPIHPRQVNETWLRRFRAWAYAGGFGWQIGTGFATYIMTGAVYLTVAVGVASADPTVAFGLGLVFGGVRGLCVFVAAGAKDHAALQRLHARIEQLAGVSLSGAIAAQVAGVAILAVTARTPVLFAVAAIGGIVAIAVRGRRSLTTVRSVGDPGLAAAPRP